MPLSAKSEELTFSQRKVLREAAAKERLKEMHAHLRKNGMRFRNQFEENVADELCNLPYVHSEELLFIDAAGLGLSKRAIAAVKKYQRKYLPNRSAEQPRTVRGPELKRLRADLSKHGDAEPNVKAVYFNISPVTGTKVLIVRSDGETGLVL